MAQHSRSLIGLFFVVIICFFIFAGLALHTVNIFSLDDKEVSAFDDKESPIAVVEVTGVILSSKEIIEKLLLAEENSKTKAIIIRIDSPGGAVGPVQEIYQEIIRIDKKIPVYASFGAIAASGGYYIAAATRKIFSPAGALTGSIGVIMQFYDISKLLELAKVSPNIIKAGKYKDAGGGHRALTEEEKNLMDSMLAQVHSQFMKDISEIRKDKLTVPIEELAQGQIFSGEKAMEVGLVDELASLWEAGRKIHEELKLPGKFSLRYVKKKKNTSILDFVERFEEAVSPLEIFSKIQAVPMFLFELH